MPRMRALRKQEDIDKVPLDQPVLIETAEAPEPPVEVDVTADPPAGDKPAIDKALVEKPDDGDDATTALTKQLADLRKAEETVRAHLADEQRRREAAEREVATRTQEAARYRDGEAQAQFDAISNAIGAQQERIEAARRDLKASLAAGDLDLQADAIERMSEAKSELVSLEAGKSAFEARREASKVEIERATNRAADPIDRMTNLSAKQRDWLKDHRDAHDNPAQNARLNAAHFDAIEARLRQDTPDYFAFIEEKLGYREPEAGDEPDADEPPVRRQPERRRIAVSAPVSRDPPSPSTGRPLSQTRVELSTEERDIAKKAGITDKEYALQKLRLVDMKKNGYYER